MAAVTGVALVTPPANIPTHMTPRTPRPSLADGIPGRRQVNSGRMSEALRAMWIFGRPTLDHYAKALQAKNRQDTWTPVSSETS